VLVFKDRRCDLRQTKYKNMRQHWRIGVEWLSGVTTMRAKIAIVAVLCLLASMPAAAKSFVGARDNWSSLEASRLQRMPSQISTAIRAAQKVCAMDTPMVRTGFLQYFKSSNGREFVSLHFEKFRCDNSIKLCGNNGCLHNGSRGMSCRQDGLWPFLQSAIAMEWAWLSIKRCSLAHQAIPNCHGVVFRAR
jgi:hypothetical protein